jgi:hypothetical protein
MDELLPLFDSGAIAPPPVKIFPAGQATEAFRHFSQARHVGKIALDLRDPDLQVAGAHNGAAPIDGNGAYLITGGLSGFGFAIGKRLAEAGAAELRWHRPALRAMTLMRPSRNRAQAARISDARARHRGSGSGSATIRDLPPAASHSRASSTPRSLMQTPHWRR